MVEALELPFYSSTPDVLGTRSFPLTLGCPVKGCAGDVPWPQISDPSPPHDSAHAVLVAVGEKM